MALIPSHVEPMQADPLFYQIGRLMQREGATQDYKAARKQVIQENTAWADHLAAKLAK